MLGLAPLSPKAPMGTPTSKKKNQGLPPKSGSGAAKKPNLPPTPRLEMTSPVDGEIIDGEDLDAVLQAHAQINQHLKECYGFLNKLKGCILQSATFRPNVNTAYVVGKNLKAKITLPSAGWDSSALKTLKAACENSTDNIVREFAGKIVAADFKMYKRDFDQLIGTNRDSPDFEKFKELVIAAQKPATGAPTISIVTLDSD